MEVFTMVVMHYGMKECSKEMLFATGIESISGNKTCMATNGQEYETIFERDIFGKLKQVKKPKYCKTMIVCQGLK